MSTDETKVSDFKKSIEADHSHIKGWGVDADTKNDPTYPMKNRTNEEHKGYSWERPPQQRQTVEILKSVERPNLTATFGTPNPPSGLSGMIRRLAFKYSESSFAHWLPLIIADRIGAVEGVIDDLAHGHVPNLFAEHGLKSEWKYNRKAFVQKVAVNTIIAGVVVGLIVYGRKKRFKL